MPLNDISILAYTWHLRKEKFGTLIGFCIVQSFYRLFIPMGHLVQLECLGSCDLSFRCQDSSMLRFLRIDPMVNGLSPTSAKLSLRVRRVASSL